MSSRENAHQRAKSLSREHLVSNVEWQRSNNDNGSVFNEMGLSKKSKLNERYLLKKSSISLDRLQLSEKSKLNQRYIASQNEMTKPKNESPTKPDSPPATLSKRSVSMQELGLASSALNDRYFASRQLQKTTSLTGGSECVIGKNQAQPNLPGMYKQNDLEKNSKGRPVNMSTRPLPEEPLELEEGKHRHSHIHPQAIRPSSRSSSASSLSSNATNEIFPADDNRIDKGHGDKGDPTARFEKLSEQGSRYQKYSGRSRHPPNPHSTKGHLDKTKDLDYSSIGFRSSAMSDTSEAPSLASHVKNVKIPSHASELDQYLDDLFNPVLDGNLDELSDARSLAASIKGGSDYISDTQHTFNKGSDGEINEGEITICQYSNEADSFWSNINTEDFDDLLNPQKLATSLKGGGETSAQVSANINHNS